VQRLTHEVRSEITRRLACFEKPADIVRWLKAELDMDVDMHKVMYHDPTRVQGRSLGQSWRILFDTARKGFLTNVETVPIANQGYRLAMLDMLFNDAVKAKNKIEARSCLEQAAKEIGGIYSNVRTLNTPDMGKATAEIPAEERSKALADLIDGAMGRLKVIEGTPSAPK
jgi:hypothetical protein